MPHALRPEPAAVIAEHLLTFHAPLKVGRRIGEATFGHSREIRLGDSRTAMLVGTALGTSLTRNRFGRVNLDPVHYTDLALRCRRLSHGFISDVDRNRLLEVAADFDKRADELESHAQSAVRANSD